MLDEAAAAAASAAVDVGRDLTLDLGEAVLELGLDDVALVERLRGAACDGSRVGVFGVEDAPFFGQLDAVALQVGDGRVDVALGELGVDVGGAELVRRSSRRADCCRRSRRW